MKNTIKNLAIEIAKREKIEWAENYIKEASPEELFDFVQYFGHPKTKEFLRPKKFFTNTSLFLLHLIDKGQIDIKKIASKELNDRVCNLKK